MEFNVLVWRQCLLSDDFSEKTISVEFDVSVCRQFLLSLKF